MKINPIRFLAVYWMMMAGFLPGAERDPQLRMLQPGVRLTLVAEHSQLATPTGVDVDDKGRVWVVATHTHFAPKDYQGPKHDEILIFSDWDAEGKAGRRQVFYNRTVATMDLELGPNGWVYLAERDRILRIRDTDGDGQADLEQNLVVIKTEADYPHNGLSGLAWGPSGELVFALGENFAKPWTLTSADGKTFRGVGEGGIFRCTANGKKLRRIARGFWNPFGVCVRADGEIFAVENDPGERPPCRLLHIIEGGDYGYQRAYGQGAHHPFVGWNGELRGTLPMIHPSGEAPCGVQPLGRGLLVPSWSDHRIDYFALKRKGASFAAKRMALVTGGRYFRPTCIARDRTAKGNKSVWYLADWVDGRYQAHGYGRLWRLEIDLEKAPWIGPLTLEPPNAPMKLATRIRSGKGKFSRAQLLGFAKGEDPFIARPALLELARQATGWKRNEIAQLKTPDRIQAVLALKLSGAAPGPWVRQFLADKNPDVQFETLRWIADAQLVDFLSGVEKLLRRNDLSYQLFEAALATRNTLKGKSEAGVRDVEMLLARVRDASVAPSVRAFSLRLLPTQPRVASKAGAAPTQNFPKELTAKLLGELVNEGNEQLALEAIRALSGNPKLGKGELLKSASNTKLSARLRAEAIAGLAVMAADHRQSLINLSASPQRAIREEALRALRHIPLEPKQTARISGIGKAHPESADLVRAIINPGSLAQGRPLLTDTRGWLKRIKNIAPPIDLESGRRLFHHARIGLCSRCHRHDGRGSVVGPDLSRIGEQTDRASLLESILQPNLAIAPEYLPRMITLKDGTTFTGIRLRSWTGEAMRDTNGQNRVFNRDDITAMRELQISFMPAGLPFLFTDRELRDLIAFLEDKSTTK
jgi:putative membrane-bound dehydrogenase-like protein